MHALSLEFLREKLIKGAKVLDIGSGTGYLTAAFYELVKQPQNNETQVVALEHIGPLVEEARGNL